MSRLTDAIDANRRGEAVPPRTQTPKNNAMGTGSREERATSRAPSPVPWASPQANPTGQSRLEQAIDASRRGETVRPGTYTPPKAIVPNRYYRPAAVGTEPAQSQKPTEKPRKATLYDMTIGSIKRGYDNAVYGRELYKDMTGQENQADEYAQKMAGDEYNFEAGGFLSRALSGGMELLGQQVRQWTDPLSVGLAGTAATGAAIAGQAGPQVLVPEEVITVPGAFLAGLQVGSTKANFEIEAGHAYKEMLDNGISEETASKIATGVGIGNAALEFVQLDELAKSFKILDKIGADDSIIGAVKRELTRRGVDIAKETAQEVAQEGVTIAGTQIGSKIDTGKWAYDSGDVLGRLGDTAASSALSFGTLNVPGGAYNVYQQTSGKDTQNAGGKSAEDIGATFQEMGDDVVLATIQEGLASDPSTRSYQLAQQLQQKLDNGETITNAELGRLYQANVQAIDAEDASGDILLRAADEVARKGRVTNSTATDILDNPSAMNTLAQEAGLSVTEDMSKAQQRKAVKTAVEGLARARETAAGETATTETSQQEKAAETAQVRPAAQQVHDIKRMQQAASALGENGAKALNTAYDGSAASDSFYAGFVAYYEAGVSGMDMSKVRSEYSAQLNQAQKFAAYVAGQNDAEVSLARERRAAQYAKVAGTDSGLVFDDYVASSMDTATADRVNSIAKALGVRVRFVDSVRGGTANAQVSGSDILVEKNNPNPVMFLLGHEWTHRMQELAPDEYRAFRDAVAEDAQGEARVLLDQYRRAGEDISYEAALDEAAANYAGRMIEDGKVLDDFIEKHRDNRTLLEKVRDAIRSIISKLTGAERRQAQTAEGKLAAALEASAKQASALQGKRVDGTMGATRNSLKEDLENGRARKEARAAFLQRAAGEGYAVYEGKTAAYGYRNVRGRSAKGNARQVQEEVKKLGIDAEIIDGPLLWNRDGITGTREVQQAVTVDRARIFINNASTISPRNIAGHEAFHLWRSGTGRDAYIEIVEDNLLFSSEAFREYQSAIAEAYLGGEADLNNDAQMEKLREELFAYISGDIHEGVYDDFLRTMLRDFDAVKAAWSELVTANASTTRFSMKKGLEAYLSDLDAVTAEIAEVNKQDIFAVFNESGNDGMIAFMKKKDALAAKKRRIERKIAELSAPEIESADPVDSKAFKLWFGDWSSGKGSKVVDADGRPLVVYHGTGTTIEEFLPEFTGQGNDQYGSGFYFTTDKNTADGYTTRTLNEQDKPGGMDNPNVIPVYLNIRHPLVLDATKTSNLYSIDVSPTMASRIISRMPDIMDPENSILGDYFDEYWERGPKNYMISQLAREYEWTLGALETDIFRGYPTEFRQAVKDVLGYDGVQINFSNGEKHFVAWFPNQIKHATENSGAFSKKDNRIKYSIKTDSQGRTLTEQQREYFKDSKAVDDKGRLMVMYHLSGANDITVFQSGNSAGLIYFSADRNYAKRAARASSTTYECYLNITNPVNTENTPLQWYEAEDSLRVAKWKRAGYDGVYVRDESGVSVAVFSPEQIKSVTNENPTSDPDIRHSLKGSETARDMAKLREENDLLRERVDYWKGQTRRTKRVTTDKKAVTKAARELIRSYGSDLSVDDISGDLQSLYDYIASGYDGADELTYTEARRRAEAIAKKLVDNAVAVDDEQYQEYADLRSYLRTTKLTISEEDSHDIADYGDFRKRNMGRLNLGKGNTNIDRVYQEMSSLWPEFFDEQRESHPVDQLLHIAEVMDGIYDITEYNPFSRYMEQAITGAANEIMETFFDLPQTKATFADRQARKLEEAKAKGRQQVQKVREQSNSKLEELREQNRQRVQDAIAKERDRRDKQIEKLKTRYREKDAAGRERRNARELRAKIVRHANALSQKLLRPSDKQHIPESLRQAVAAMLESINLESAYTTDPNTGKRVKDGSGTPTKRTEAFRALKEQYEAIRDGKTDFTGVLDPELVDNLAELIKAKDTPLSDMSTAQLATVWNTLKAVEASVSSANKLFSKGRFSGVEELAYSIQDSSRGKRAKNNYGGNGLGKVSGFGDQLLNVDMLNPLTFLHLFGEGGDALYHELQEARDRKTEIMERTAELVQDVIGKADISAMQEKTHTFQVSGGEITLSTAQLMSLYELTKREQAQDHIYKGGLRPTAQKKATNLLGKLENPPDGVKVEPGDVSRMLSALTEQEVKIADGLQAIMQGYLADEGNRESMKVFGYRKFTEEHYFPISSDPNHVQSKIGDILEGGVKRPVSVAEWGSAKGTTKGANNGLLLGDIFDVFAQHAVDMSTYASHLGALEDVNRVRNFTFRNEEGDRTGQMKSIIQRVAGQHGNAYLDKLLQDISRGTAKGGVTGLSRLTANYKAASVGLNLRVALQQPTSYARTLAVMDGKYLADPRVMKMGGWEKALKYAPIARWKDWGNFEVNQGRQFQDILFGTDSKLERARNASMKLASAMDSLTWGRIWNACELETADLRRDLTRGSEAFYCAVAQRFTDVVDQTQVVDNVLGRSQFMRSGDNLAKMASSYMGEPTQSYNLFYRAYRDAVQEQNPTKRRQAAKRMGRAAGALVFSMFLNAVAQSLWDAVRDDDDRDEKYWERVLGHILPNFAQNVNPMGMVPYLRDVLSILQGYDVERMDLAAVTGLVQAARGMQKALNGEGRYTVIGAGANLVAELSRVVGLPVPTVKRDMLAVARSIGIETGDWYFQYQIERAINSLGYSGNRKEFYDIAFGALSAGELDVYQHITADMMAGGIKASSIEAAMRDRLEAAQTEDPAFTLTQRAKDLIGTSERYGHEEKTQDGFGAGDLDPAAYARYNAQRAETYRTWANELEQSTGFRRMNDAGKDNALDAAEKLAKHLALIEHSGGQVAESDLSQWERWATSGEAWGVDPTEAILFKAAYDMSESDKDEAGKTISGSKKENTLEAAAELLPGLTDEELEYLMSNFWKPEDRELSEMKERGFMP